MQRRVFAFLISALLFQGTAAARADIYGDLVAKAERGEPVDYAVLRLSYAHSAGYDPHLMTRPLFITLLKAFYAKDYGKMCASVEAGLRLSYVDPLLHVFRLECLAHANDQAGMNREIAIADGLNRAILQTGDGKSLRTAYRIVTLGETGAAIGHYGLKLDGAAEIADSGHRYFMLIGIAPHPHAAKWLKIYFNIDGFGASRALRPKALQLAAP